MVDFFSNKWKIFSIGLMVILATGFVAPQAYAVINPDAAAQILQIWTLLYSPTFGLKAIFNKISTGSSQASIDSLQKTTNQINATGNAIKLKISTLPANIATNPEVVNATSFLSSEIKAIKVTTNSSLSVPKPNSRIFSFEQNLGNASSGTSIADLPIIPIDTNKTFSGHVSAHVLLGTNVRLVLLCDVPSDSVLLYDQSGGTAEVNEDFTCSGLDLRLTNQGPATEAVLANGIAQFENSTSISTVAP